MFVGYSKDHDGDCYDMYYPKTNSIYTTRDVIWLRRMYYNLPVEEGVHTPLAIDGDGIEELMLTIWSKGRQMTLMMKSTRKKTRNVRLVCKH